MAFSCLATLWMKVWQVILRLFLLLLLFLCEDLLAHTYFHFLSQDQSTVAQQAEMTVAKCSLMSCLWAHFPKRESWQFPSFAWTAESAHTNFIVPSNTWFSLAIMRWLEDHEGTVSIGGRTITNLRFADDMDGLAGEEEKNRQI